MSFSNMLEILQEKNKGKIVLVKLGVFYIATGKDAVLLNNKLNLKCTCFKNNVCKIGIPINALDKYIEKLNQIKYSYIVKDLTKKIKNAEITSKEARMYLCGHLGYIKYANTKNLEESIFYIDK